MSSNAAEGGQAMPPVKIVVLGATGSGKTSLVKALTTGMEVGFKAPLTIGNTVESETKVTNVVNAGKFLIVDPPGIGDTYGNDESNMVELAKTVRSLEYLHLVVLVLNGQQVRLDTSLLQMLRDFENVFSPAFWANAALVFTRWYPDEIGEFPGDEVRKKGEWNNALKAEFSFFSEYRKAAPIPCFFVNSVVVHDDRYRASARMQYAVAQNESTMTAIRRLAQDLQPLRTSSMSVSQSPALVVQVLQPLQTSCISVSPSQPLQVPVVAAGGTMHEVAQFLHGLGLVRYVPHVLAQKIHTRDVLGELSDLELVDLGFEQKAISKIRQGLRSRVVRGLPPPGDPTDTPQQLATELGSFGIPTEPFATCTVHAALSLSEHLVLQRLPLLGDRKVFQRWRGQRLAGQNVSDECLWLGARVERGMDWEYEPDSHDEDALPQDGEPGGHGIVVGWQTRKGDRVGEDVPNSPGWVRVRWLITGFSHNYRAGADSMFELRFACGTLHGESLDAVEKVEIKHLRCTFGYATGVKFPRFCMFDVRPTVCQMVGGFEHGDVVVTEGHQDRTRAVCIGAKPDGRKGISLWFHAKDQCGANDFSDLGTGNYRKVGRERVRPAQRDDFTCDCDAEIENDDCHYVMKNLRPTFGYGTRRGFNRFDIRDEILARFKLGVHHGDLVLDRENGNILHCIGVAELIKGSKPRVWFHIQGEFGAVIAPDFHRTSNRFKILRNEAIAEVTEEQSTFVSEEDLREIAAELRPTFAFPRGLGSKPSLCRFDIRPNIVSRITGGFLPGQVFQVENEKLVVVGASPEPGTNQPRVWFFREGDSGAGLFEWDCRQLLHVFQNTGETKDLLELKKQVEAAKKLVSGNDDSDSEDVGGAQKQLHHLFARAMTGHCGGRT